MRTRVIRPARRQVIPLVVALLVLSLYLWQTVSAWQQALGTDGLSQKSRVVWRSTGVHLNNVTGTAVMSGASATLIADSRPDTGVLVIQNLPMLPPREVYRLWGIDATSIVDAAATFSVPYDNRDTVFVRVITPQLLTTYSRFLITIEPDDGSNQAPSGRVVMNN